MRALDDAASSGRSPWAFVPAAVVVTMLDAVALHRDYRLECAGATAKLVDAKK